MMIMPQKHQENTHRLRAFYMGLCCRNLGRFEALIAVLEIYSFVVAFAQQRLTLGNPKRPYCLYGGSVGKKIPKTLEHKILLYFMISLEWIFFIDPSISR